MSKQLMTRFEVKDLDEEARTFSGLAATWDLDLGGDVIQKGAFKRTLSFWKKSKRVLPLLDSHNGRTVRAVVGKMTEAEETGEGLLATFEVIEGPDGDEVFRRVKGRYVDGLSIGYEAVKVKYAETEEERKQGIWRYLQEVKLHEVSVVLWPMNTEARIGSVKALQERAAELRALKEGRGLSDEEKRDLRHLEADIRALLAGDDAGTGTPEGAPPTSGSAKTQPGPAHEVTDRLQERIGNLKLHRLARRIDQVLCVAKASGSPGDSIHQPPNKE